MRARFLGFGLALGLAGCGGGPPPPPVVYKPLNYSYLPAFTLRVGAVNVQNVFVPTPAEATLIGEDPEAPANALSDMLNRRVIPSGAPGSADVTIETASLDESGGILSGTMTVRVAVKSGDGHDTGYTEATVTRSEQAPDSGASDEDVRAALYGMTKDLMDAMNVQLQYQLQHDLASWLVYSNNAAAAPVGAGAGAGIVVTPLPGPGPAGAPPAGPPPAVAPGGTLPAGTLPLGTLPLGTVPVPATGVSQ